MGCKLKKSSNIKKDKHKINEFISDNLKETGREQFFQHYPHSKLPIRDITKKTEPHIEIGAENYLRSCIQPNIINFLNSSERYLFLCTTCKNRKIYHGFFGKRFIIGFIEKNNQVKVDHHVGVIGKTYIVPFDKHLEYKHLGFARTRGMQKFDQKDTEKLLGLIRANENIRKKCIKEMIMMENREREKNRLIPLDKECRDQKNMCNYKKDCLRRLFLNESNSEQKRF